MPKLTTKQQNKLRRIAQILDGDKMGLIAFLQELEDKIDKNIPDLKEILLRFKGGAELEDKDKLMIAERVLPLVDLDNLADKSSKLIDLKNLAKETLKLVKVPVPKDGKTPTKKELKKIIKPLLVNEDKLKSDIIDDVKSFIPEDKPITDIRNGFEVLQGDERLKVSAISGLEEMVKKLKEELESKISSSKGSVGRASRFQWQPMVDRFADQTDGTTKSFLLKKAPMSTDTITVSCSDFPFELDPTVDFTVSGKTLTLTSAVDAPSSGSTLVIRYYS